MSIVGDKISDLNGKVTGMTFSESGNTATVEWDDMNKFGSVAMTATFWPPVDVERKTGRYSEVGYTFRPDGSTLSFTVEGIWSETSQGNWKIYGTALAEDGVKIFVTIDYEFAAKSARGAIYELD